MSSQRWRSPLNRENGQNAIALFQPFSFDAIDDGSGKPGGGAG
jgi:hypothetical protein